MNMTRLTRTTLLLATSLVLFACGGETTDPNEDADSGQTQDAGATEDTGSGSGSGVDAGADEDAGSGGGEGDDDAGSEDMGSSTECAWPTPRINDAPSSQAIAAAAARCDKEPHAWLDPASLGVVTEWGSSQRLQAGLIRLTLESEGIDLGDTIKYDTFVDK